MRGNDNKHNKQINYGGAVTERTEREGGYNIEFKTGIQEGLNEKVHLWSLEK